MSGLERTARLFRRRRRQWISALVLMRVGGLLAWRTRVSEARRQLGMRIDQKTERTASGQTRSFYRYSGKTT